MRIAFVIPKPLLKGSGIFVGHAVMQLPHPVHVSSLT